MVVKYLFRLRLHRGGQSRSLVIRQVAAGTTANTVEQQVTALYMLVYLSTIESAINLVQKVPVNKALSLCAISS